MYAADDTVLMEDVEAGCYRWSTKRSMGIDQSHSCMSKQLDGTHYGLSAEGSKLKAHRPLPWLRRS